MAHSTLSDITPKAIDARATVMLYTRQRWILLTLISEPRYAGYASLTPVTNVAPSDGWN